MTHYEVLEVSPQASPEVIRAAYRSLMQRYHPDRNPGNAQYAEKAAQIARAYEVLSDAGKRASYDAELRQSSLQVAVSSVVTGRAVRQQAASDESSGSRIAVALFVIFGALIAWYMFSPSGKARQLPPDAELKAIRESIEGRRLTPQQLQEKSERINEILASNAELRRSDAQERARAISARTILPYVEKLTVRLSVPDSAGVQRVLSIPTLGVVVGSFDSEKFMRHVEQNRDYIVRRIEVKLADARVGALSGTRGQEHLKEFLLDAFAEITGTSRKEIFPATYAEAPGRYGVVDVFFPDSFTIE